MTNEDKRQEVAARLRVASNLRASRGFISKLPKTTPEQNAFDVFEHILACIGYEHGNIFDYLADLIDPTCTVVGRSSQDWSDGSTDYINELSCGHECRTNWPEPPAYCDECGARVVDDE